MKRWYLLLNYHSSLLQTMLGVMVSCSSVFGGDLILTFDYASTVKTKSFLFTYHSSNDAPDMFQQFRVANTTAMHCVSLQGVIDLTADSRCARPPTCLAEGMYIFWVQAEGEEGQVSEQSNRVGCHSDGNCVYNCTNQITNAITEAPQHPATTTDLPLATKAQTVGQPITDRQRVGTSLAQGASSPATPAAVALPPYVPL